MRLNNHKNKILQCTGFIQKKLMNIDDCTDREARDCKKSELYQVANEQGVKEWFNI